MGLLFKKKLSQWFLKISKYSDELLNELDNLTNWPNKVKIMQSNWIGKSAGAEIDFVIDNSKEKITVFTTRPTQFRATFIALSVDHELIEKLKNNKELKAFIEKCGDLNPDKLNRL